MDAETALLQGITAAIADTTDGDSAMVTSYVVLAEFLGDDGERLIYHAVGEGQRCHTTLGLLEYGSARERARAAQAGEN